MVKMMSPNCMNVLQRLFTNKRCYDDENVDGLQKKLLKYFILSKIVQTQCILALFVDLMSMDAHHFFYSVFFKW